MCIRDRFKLRTPQAILHCAGGPPPARREHSRPDERWGHVRGRSWVRQAWPSGGRPHNMATKGKP
eukprot:2773675-Alexandrium_andersonii.AAC.1